MVEVASCDDMPNSAIVSIRRADYWLVEDVFGKIGKGKRNSFNPPGGLLVG